jgi:acyl-CoA synthetase (AMP-forming)/AMP-acid ligase II/3-hydroxymyristoyl/3-hydroxydecanoyl-(acyl carrier protein) dehydratase
MAEASDMLSFAVMPRPLSQIIAWRPQQSVSYGEFLDRTRAWQRLLTRISGQTFALSISDAAEFAAALFGAWHARKTIYLPSDRLPRTCHAMRSVVDGYLGEFAAEWKPRMPTPEDGLSPAAELKPLDSNFAGLVIYTSGSSGVAQAIPKNLSQISAEIATLETQFGDVIDDSDIVATVSHQHIYGLLFNVLWPLSAGRAFAARSFGSFEGLAKTLAQRDSVLVSTPAHLQRLPETPAWELASKRLRAVFSSGGPLPADVARETRQLLGHVPIEVYGSSETGGIAWRQQQTAHHEEWTPLPNIKWRIDAEEGVLEIRSAHLPDAEWFRTADRARPAGYDHFVLKGRVDRIAKIEGKRISLGAIEERLTASPLARDARALVVEGRRQRIAVVIVPSACGRDKLAQFGKLAVNRMLRDLLSETIEPVGLPRLWRYVDVLPINAQGKTTQAALLALFGDRVSRHTQPIECRVHHGNQHAVFNLIAPSDLLYFDGHFGDMPILAGVVQIEWVIAFGRRCFDLPPWFCAIHALKFQRVISPELPITLELVHDPLKSCLSFKISSQLGAHASGQIIFKAADDV